MKKTHIFLIAVIAGCLAAGCAFLRPAGQPSAGTSELVNPQAPQGEPIGGTPTEEGFVYETFFDAPAAGYDRQRAARLEEILTLYDGVDQASVTWDAAGRQVRVTVSTQSPLTAEQEEAMRSTAAAVFPEGSVQLDRIQAAG